MMIELKLRDGAIILETDLDLSKWKRFEAEIILLTVRCYLKYSLSYRDLGMGKPSVTGRP
ncbi:hypothetical protein PAENI_30180 [Paenibacillus sp. B2(2019)]|nr:hypothetical protein PAENI_30180 [Paenibacillus sp. B2(2019)]